MPQLLSTIPSHDRYLSYVASRGRFEIGVPPGGGGGTLVVARHLNRGRDFFSVDVVRTLWTTHMLKLL
jgi:hypothetical protein